jgi:aminopeptidase N
MEDAGTVFFQADRLPRDRVSGVIAHEATHQWFGNTVVIDSWYDLWLNESIATYLTTLYQGYTRGPDRSRLLWAGMAEVGPGREPGGKPLYSADSSGLAPALTWEMYEKGGSVLHTLRLRIGDEAFFGALREISRSYRSRPLNSKAFQREMERASGEKLDAFFEAWVYGSDLPRLKTAWEQDTGRLTWEIVDHAEMVDGVAYSLEITVDEQSRYVDAEPGLVTLEPGSTRPVVRPVGVMMYVD